MRIGLWFGFGFAAIGVLVASGSCRSSKEAQSGATCTEVSAACDDGNACTIDDRCDSGGHCSGTVRSCDDGHDCTADSCDPVQGCSHSILDGFCFIENTCYEDGHIRADRPCQECSCKEDATDWTADDSNACPGDGVCTLSADCRKGLCVRRSLDCNDGIDCTIDSCDNDIGCIHTATDSACNDDDPTTKDRCDPETGCLHAVPWEGD